MSEPRTPQVPMIDGDGNPFYPMTQYNQIVLPDGSRWDGKGGGAQIDDATPSGTKVYSSQKVESIASQLSQQKANKAGWTADKFLGTDANGNMVTKDVPESSVDWNAIYPVGSIYMSTVDFCAPAAVIPGSNWVRIEDRFLLGAGNTYAAGREDGKPTVTLTSGQLAKTSVVIYAEQSGGALGPVPANMFYLKSNTWEWAGATDKAGEFTRGIFANVGNSEPHENMPPYLSVYMWKREEP